MKKIAIALSLLIITKLEVNAQTCFGSTTNYAVVNNAQGITTKDVNNDAIPDLIVTNGYSGSANTVSVFLGLGTGAFNAGTDFSADDIPTGVITGDFNNDGKIDIATANVNANTISILLGNGAGSFGSATNFATNGSASYALISGDFNGDNKADLAVANNNSNDISILINNGSGSFGTATIITVGTTPNSIICADFNNDGKKDLATANYSSNDVSVLLGTGTGTFGAVTTFSANTGAGGIVTADFNGDGKLDLATANSGSNTMSLLLGTGTGSFGLPTDFPVGSYAYAIVTADFNNDTKADIAIANLSSNNVSVLIGDGSGNFLTHTDFGVDQQPISIAAADFNLDGKIDLTTANLSPNDASVLLNSPVTTLSNVTGPTTLCNIDSLILTASGATSYTWSTGSNNGDYYTPNSSATYTVTGSNGCTFASATTKVILSSSPVVTINSSGSTTFCAGNTVTLNAAVVDADAIHFTASSSQYVDLSAYITNLTTADFTMEAWIKTTGISEGIINCSDGDSNWEMGEKAFYIDASGKPAFVGWGCGYIYSTLAVNDGNWHHVAVSWDYTNTKRYIFIDGIDYTNNPSSDFHFGNTDVGTFRIGMPNGPGGAEASNYFNGDMKQIRIWKIIRTQAQIQANMNINIAIYTAGLLTDYKTIEGTGTILNDFTGAYNGTLQNGVTWVTSNDDAFLWSTGSTTTSFTVNASNSYTLTATNNYTGCSNITTQVITVNPTPTITVTGTSVICNGGNTTLTVSGANTYTWSNSVNTATNTVSPTGNITYTVIGTDNNNCTNNVTQSVIVHSLPIIITNTSDTAICIGMPITLTSTGANTYTWTGGITNGMSFNPSTPQTYTVTGTDLNNCVNTATVNVQVNSLPIVTVNSATICANSSANLTAHGANTYVWNTTATTASISVSPTITTIYTVTGTDVNTCANTTTAMVNVSVNPAPQICMVTTDSASNYNYNIIYWDKTQYVNVDSFIVYRLNGATNTYVQIGVVSKDSSSLIDTARSIGGGHGGDPNYTSYRYTLAIKDTCGNTSAQSQYHQTEFLQYLSGGNFNISAYAVNGGVGPVTGYNLFRDDNNTGTFNYLTTITGTTATDPQYASYPNANYRVDVLGFNCNITERLSSINNTLTTRVRSHSNAAKQQSGTTGIKQPGANNVLVIYPNPASSTINIKCPSINAKTIISLYDAAGRIIMQQQANGNTTQQLDIQQLEAGIYFIEVNGIRKFLSITK